MNTYRNAYRAWGALRAGLSNEEGMSTIEYAMGSVAAAALAGVLYLVVSSGGVEAAFETILTDALNNVPS
ncbi:membrane protein [Corynebacterium phocae]|uniref:Membrane protein n=1 Tax=Corynebacterium phocae TaxID=161895 RepID=A0A1L7D6K9_9CORY|nr:membrane protein [Corynebacterium phocae]